MSTIYPRTPPQPPRPHTSKGPGKWMPNSVTPVLPSPPFRACDKCGHSKVDGGPIARASHQIEVPGGDLYFCGHHFREYAVFIFSEGYPVHDIQEKVASK